MVSVISSEDMLAFAYFSAGSVTVITLLMILRILSHRLVLIRQRRRHQRFKESWEPAFTGCILEAAKCTLDAIPPLAKSERFMFLTFWNKYQESLSGFAHERLNGMARRLEMPLYARRLLTKAALRQRLAATVFLGNIRDRQSWGLLENQLHDDNALLSIQAARSLAQIDLDQALPLIFAEHLNRDDWQGSQVAAVLRRGMQAHILTPHLASLLRQCSDDQAEKLLPFMEYMYHEDRSRYLRLLIAKAQAPRLIARILKAVDSVESLDLASRFIDHDQWYVRNQAVAAISRLGGRRQVPILVGGLGDEQWWVRYRAAQGLVRILRDQVQELAAIRINHEDRYARQMIDHVLAERRYARNGAV